MKTKLMALLMMAGGALVAQPRVAIGVQIGTPAPVVVRDYRPPCPGPGYVWIDGNYDAYGNWIGGYWALPPYAGAYWVAPRIDAGHFVAGYWGGSRGDYRYNPRFEPPVRHEPERRGPEPRYRGGDRDHDRAGEFARGFRR
jgi:hypothetical protein